MDDYDRPQSGFFPATETAADEAPEAETGTVVFETSVAVKGAVMSIEVIQTPTGPVLQLTTTGGLRKPAPVKLDRYQTAALRGAVNGAAGVVDGL